MDLVKQKVGVNRHLWFWLGAPIPGDIHLSILMTMFGKNRLQRPEKNRWLTCLIGPWDKSRWGELIDSAEAFSKQSGLSDDASRSALVKAGENAVLRAGLDSETCVLLCMLGESIAIVPRNISKDISLEKLLSELTKEGLDATLTHIGTLS